MSWLIDIIWLIDVLNIKGFEFLDTTFELNTFFWSVYISIVLILGVLKALVNGDNK